MSQPQPLSPEERAVALSGLAKLEDQLGQAADWLHDRGEVRAALMAQEAAQLAGAAGWALIRSGHPELARPQLAAAPDGQVQAQGR